MSERKQGLIRDIATEFECVRKRLLREKLLGGGNVEQQGTTNRAQFKA